jgi:hypothetical protein
MPLSPNEIKERAVAFAHEWADEDSERAEAQSFWNDFFAVFGLDRKRVAVFEKQVQLARAGERLKHGRIDCFWKGTLLVEHKSAGADLDRAFAHAARAAPRPRRARSRRGRRLRQEGLRFRRRERRLPLRPLPPTTSLLPASPAKRRTKR